MAAEIERKYATPFADCFALALARRVGGIAATGDPEFNKIGCLVPVHWLAAKER